MTSLRLRLLLWVLLPMTLALALTARLSWSNARDLARLVQDRQLLASAQMMAGQVGWQDGQLTAQTPPAALEIFSSPAQDRVYFQIRTAQGRVLAGWPELTVPALPGGTAARYDDIRFQGDTVRQVTLSRALYRNNQTTEVLISVAETRRAFDQLAASLWWPTLLHESALLILALALMLLGLTLELRPLLQLRATLRARDSSDLSPLRTVALQRELRPIVETLNQHAAQLTRQIDLQKRFIADAAHQLRTPVALIATQLDYARRQPASAELQHTLEALGNGSRQLAQLINQLLSLSQAEASHGGARPTQAVDLVGLAQDVVIELAALADARDIDLGFLPACTLAQAQAYPALAHALLFNLVDNAVRYTPRCGSVTVRVGFDEGRAWLQVDDTGPGIPAELRPHVFERFYRGNSADTTGTGLGLAIVRESALAFGADVTLDNRPDSAGLSARVRFPRAEPGASRLQAPPP